MVYLVEAHASDVWQMPSNVRDDVLVATPANLEQRCQVARSCITRLSIELPAVVDEFDNRTEVAYTAWPDRLYVVDRDGRVAAKSAPGPFGFDVKLVEDALARLVPAPSAPPSGSAGGIDALKRDLDAAAPTPTAP